VAEFPENIELKEEGRPLECCAMWWLRMRLATAAGQLNFPLEKLLGVEGVVFEAEGSKRRMLKQLKNVAFNIPADDYNIRTSYCKGKLASSRKKQGASFYNQLDQLGEDTDELWLLESARGEAWDILLAVFDTQGSKWFLTFIDLKAKGSVNGADSQVRTVASLPSSRQKSWTVELVGGSQGGAVLLPISHHCKGHELCE
jgi:hypothetical protein